jgi:hypothetical protein
MFNYYYRSVKSKLKYFFKVKSQKFSKYATLNNTKTSLAGLLMASIEQREA